MKFTQSCDSRKCRKNNKSQVSKLCEAITTIHIVDFSKQEVKCLECGKITKIEKRDKIDEKK